MIHITGLDHLVLTVADIETTCAFYHDLLGMKITRFGAGRVALRFGQQKINLHEVGHEIKPNAMHACTGSADLCLLVDDTTGEVQQSLEQHGVAFIGPVPRTGALGPITSFYIRDPDHNLIELAHYGS